MHSGELREFSFKIEDTIIKIVLDGVKANFTKHAELSLHTHSFAEIFMCESDTVFIKTDGGIIPFGMGECVVVPVGCRHKVMMDSGNQNFRSIGILCENNGQDSVLFSKLVRLIDLETPYVFRDNTLLCKSVKRIAETDDKWEVFSELLTVIKCFCVADLQNKIKDVKRISGISKNIDRFIELERIVNERFISDVSYSEIADELHISERQLIRLTKKYYNESLSGLMRKRRMEVAAKLLTDTELPIETISTDIGYKSKAAFYSVFAKQFKTTPAAYRKENTKI